MTEDFHKPTYTAPRDEGHRAYNASQVRLYGIQGISFPGPHPDPGDGDHDDGDSHPMRGVTGVSDKLAVAVIEKETEPKRFLQIGMIEKLGSALGQKLVPAQSSFVFLKTIMKRYMFFLSAVDINPPPPPELPKVPPKGKKLSATSPRIANRMADGELSSGVIFGYAYEGHCYDLPKPKIMLIPAFPEEIPDDDSGYYPKRNKDYRVWIVDKLDECIEIDINQGFVEQVVLEANLPGKRSPSMYAAKMNLAHRSGRLTE